LIERQGTGS